MCPFIARLFCIIAFLLCASSISGNDHHCSDPIAVEGTDGAISVCVTIPKENERADKPIVKWTQGGELIEEGLLVLFKSDTSYHFGFAVEGKSGDKPPKQPDGNYRIKLEDLTNALELASGDLKNKKLLQTQDLYLHYELLGEEGESDRADCWILIQRSENVSMVLKSERDIHIIAPKSSE